MTPSPKILIVGGVAGGASAATRARRLNEQARIIMLEKDGFVSFANCGLPYHLGGVIQDRAKLLVAKPEMFKKRFNIEVRVRHEALSIDRAKKTVRIRDHAAGTEYDESYDKLILAPGAAPLIPDVPGVRAQGVHSLRNIEDMDRILARLPSVKKVAVVGAGFIGPPNFDSHLLQSVHQLPGCSMASWIRGLTLSLNVLRAPMRASSVRNSSSPAPSLSPVTARGGTPNE